jgi:hypothetical protein
VTRLMGVMGTSPLCPAKGWRRGAQTSQRARPDHLKWAQARGLDARLHLLDVPERMQMPVRAHGTARTAETPPRPTETNTSHTGNAL